MVETDGPSPQRLPSPWPLLASVMRPAAASAERELLGSEKTTPGSGGPRPLTLGISLSWLLTAAVITDLRGSWTGSLLMLSQEGQVLPNAPDQGGLRSETGLPRAGCLGALKLSSSAWVGQQPARETVGRSSKAHGTPRLEASGGPRPSARDTVTGRGHHLWVAVCPQEAPGRPAGKEALHAMVSPLS